MESQSEGVEDISTLLVHGSEVGADGAERIGAVFCSEAAGDFLFDLGHTNGLFGEVVGEGDIVIGGESPDIVGVEAQAQEQVGGLALSRSAPVARFRSGGAHHSVILMSVRPNSPYRDEVQDDGAVLIYEGHDRLRHML